MIPLSPAMKREARVQAEIFKAMSRYRKATPAGASDKLQPEVLDPKLTKGIATLKETLMASLVLQMDGLPSTPEACPLVRPPRETPR